MDLREIDEKNHITDPIASKAAMLIGMLKTLFIFLLLLNIIVAVIEKGIRSHFQRQARGTK